MVQGGCVFEQGKVCKLFVCPPGILFLSAPLSRISVPKIVGYWVPGGSACIFVLLLFVAHAAKYYVSDNIIPPTQHQLP